MEGRTIQFRAILFDLDGTLLAIDTDQFIEKYLQHISTYTAHLIEPKTFLKQLWASTYAMIQSKDGTLTNEDVFTGDFYEKIGISQAQLLPLLDRFYEEEFPKLEQYVNTHARVPEMIAHLKKEGYKLVVATNPLFPRSAILHRIKWAGLNPEDFDWITSYEIAHYCKPNPKYFLEIAEEIGVKPEECLMVGNDVQEDLIAQQTGMKTYLVTDHIIDREDVSFTPDGKGKMEDFVRDVLEGQGLFSVKK